MDNKTLRLLMLSAVCFCITECRPESLAASSEVRQSRSIDRMVFPDSNEDERRAGAAAPMQMRRLLSPTPRAETANDCRSIKVFRNKNGTLSHQFVDCSNSSIVTLPTPVATESRFGQEPSSQHGTSVRVGGVPTATEKNGSQRDTIVFPDNESAEAASEPKCAQPGQRFCTDDASYPKSRIEMLLQRVGNLNDLLQTDVEDDTELVQRVDVPGEETFCDYDSRMEYPTKALSRDEKWLPIVNHANYTQGIRMEICRNIDRPCKMSEIFPYSIKTKCVQKYQYRQLLALHEDGQLKREYFSMPTCCLCTFSKM